MQFTSTKRQEIRNPVLTLIMVLAVGYLTGQDDLSLGFLDTTFQDLAVGGVATTILDKDDVEVQFNNTFTSFWFRTFAFNQENFRQTVNNRRITLFNQSLRVQYGFSANRRWDLGVEARYNWYRDDDFARSSPFKIFNKKPSISGVSYSGLSSMGLRLRAMPLADHPNWIVQGGYYFPVGNHETLEKRLLSADLNQFDLITTYYGAWNSTTYYFLQANGSSQFSPARTNHVLGASAFLVKNLWNNLAFVFPGMSYAFTSQNQKQGGFATYAHLVFAVLGGQYSIRSQLQVYGVWQIPLLLDNGSLFSEWVRASYSGVSIGLRATISR